MIRVQKQRVSDYRAYGHTVFTGLHGRLVVLCPLLGITDVCDMPGVGLYCACKMRLNNSQVADPEPLEGPVQRYKE